MIVPLNMYGFFNSFKNEVAPSGKVTIEVTIESDGNLIFRAAAVADVGKCQITRFVLRVPKMILNDVGESLILRDYFKPHTWTYMKEWIETSQPFGQRQGTFKITLGISKPRHVFIWALNSTKLNSQLHNMFRFSTCNFSNNGRTITSAQLELSNGVFYPQQKMDPTKDKAEAFRTLLEYSKVSTTTLQVLLST